MGASIWPEEILSALIVLLGAPMGSFVSLLADRLPRGEPVMLDRSKCRSCGQTLRWWELIPILSYIGLRARCARCGSKIPSQLFQAELAGLALGCMAVWAGVGLVGAVVLWCLLALILSDLGHYRLPNALTFALLVMAMVYAAVSLGAPMPNFTLLGQAALGAAVGAGIFFAISWSYQVVRGRSGMGAGDIRLIGGIGALVVPVAGWVGLGMVTLIAGLAGLVLGVSRAIRRGRALSARTPVPFGACLALAAVVVWLAASVHPGLFAGP